MCANVAFFLKCPLAEREKTRKGVVTSSLQKASFQQTTRRKQQCFKASLHQPSFAEQRKKKANSNHPRLLRELAEEISELLVVIFKSSRSTQRRKLAKMGSIFQKRKGRWRGRKEEPRNYTSTSVNSWKHIGINKLYFKFCKKIEE